MRVVVRVVVLVLVLVFSSSIAAASALICGGEGGRPSGSASRDSRRQGKSNSNRDKAGCGQMNTSFKAEEILIRDKTVAELQDKVKQLEDASAAAKAAHAAALTKAREEGAVEEAVIRRSYGCGCCLGIGWLGCGESGVWCPSQAVGGRQHVSSDVCVSGGGCFVNLDHAGSP